MKPPHPAIDIACHAFFALVVMATIPAIVCLLAGFWFADLIARDLARLRVSR